MNISIRKPYFFCEAGNGSKDFIYPDSYATDKNRLFLICENVAYPNKNKLAGSVLCDAIRTYFRTFLVPDETFEPAFIEKAIRYSEICFDNYIKKNPTANRLIANLCLLYVDKNGIFLIHTGNSRIYQFREGKFIFKTKPEESARRAIQGSQKPVNVDIIRITDIRADDQFLMCSEGITKILSEKELCEVLSKDISTEEKLNEINGYCNYDVSDQYVTYLIPIHDVYETNIFKQIVVSFLYAFI